MSTIFNFEILGNSLPRIGWFLIIILFAFVFSRYASKFFSALIYRLFRRYTKESYGSKFHALVAQPLQYLLVLLIVRTAIESLTYPESWKVSFWNHPLQILLDELLWTLVLLAFTWLMLRIIDYIAYLLHERAEYTASRADDQLVPFVKDALKIFIVINALFILLGGVFDLDLTSLLAGLGIGGLAVAFAAQESIKDIFGSITVFLDKPFVVGDVVKIGEVEGTVERVGIRSTKMRTANRTLVTVPNKKMLDSSVDNQSQRSHRRVRQVIGLTYQTTAEQLKKIIGELQDYFKNSDELNKDYVVVFDDFGESSLNILLIYYVPFSPYEEHMMLKEQINYRIMEVVERNGSCFAFPVREIRLDPELFKKS
ncbi:MAG: mechanosensitive ion channel family protein [Chitinophagales bacterium]